MIADINKAIWPGGYKCIDGILFMIKVMINDLMKESVYEACYYVWNV